MTTEARLNARLDADAARKLEYLKRKTRRSTTDVVRRSIELYYESVAGGVNAPARALDEAGFVGCSEGPIDLSDRYKQELAELLSKKS